MGRLVDSVMAALGLKPSDRVVLECIEKPDQPPSPQHPENDGKNCNATIDSAEQLKINYAAVDLTPKVVPSEQVIEDCLGCRIVGAACCYGLGSMALWYTAQNRFKHTGLYRKVYVSRGFFAGGALFTLGTSRLLNMGIFDPDKKDMSIKEHVKSELRFLYEKLNVEVPEGLKETKGCTEDNKTTSSAS